MPYIKQIERDEIDIKVAKLAGEIETDGQLNYAISTLLLTNIRYDPKGLSYQKLNNLMGVLECVKQEFYRTTVANYEEVKRKQNGDLDRD